MNDRIPIRSHLAFLDVIEGRLMSASPKTLGLRSQSELDLLRQQCARLRELLNWLDAHRDAFSKVEKAAAHEAP